MLPEYLFAASHCCPVYRSAVLFIAFLTVRAAASSQATPSLDVEPPGSLSPSLAAPPLHTSLSVPVFLNGCSKVTCHAGSSLVWFQLSFHRK